MTDLNHVDVIGRCVKQPDLVKKGPSGVSVLTFTLAVNRDFFKKDMSNFEKINSKKGGFCYEQLCNNAMG